MPQTEKLSKTITIKGSVTHIYDLCRDYESLPQFLNYVKEVRQIDEEITRWRLVSPDGHKIEWKVRLTRTDKDKRIAWNTPEGDIKTSGQAVFSQLPDDETQISLTLNYVLPDNASPWLREQVQEILDKVLEEELNNLKKHAEGMEERLTKRR